MSLSFIRSDVRRAGDRWMYCIKFPNKSQRERERLLCREVKGHIPRPQSVLLYKDKQMPTSLSVDLNTDYHFPLFNSKSEFNKHYHTPTYALLLYLSLTHTLSLSLTHTPVVCEQLTDIWQVLTVCLCSVSWNRSGLHHAFSQPPDATLSPDG